MIGRRGLLGLLAGAPIAGRAIAEEAMQRGIGMASAVSNAGPQIAYPTPEDPAFRALRRKLWQRHQRLDQQMMVIPPEIAAMKSWSASFKRRAALQDDLRRQDLMYDAEKILDGDGSIIEKTIRLAALGIEL